MCSNSNYYREYDKGRYHFLKLTTDPRSKKTRTPAYNGSSSSIGMSSHSGEEIISRRSEEVLRGACPSSKMQRRSSVACVSSQSANHQRRTPLSLTRTWFKLFHVRPWKQNSFLNFQMLHKEASITGLSTCLLLCKRQIAQISSNEFFLLHHRTNK